MVALFLTTTISCNQAMALLNRIRMHNSLPDYLKTELIDTIRETIPTCPVVIKKDGR